ncbi:MAG: hypothetical protein R2710_02360 [Acidimicrobiales bacterium]
MMLDQFGLQLAALWREHLHDQILELLDYKINGYPWTCVRGAEGGHP